MTLLQSSLNGVYLSRIRLRISFDFALSATLRRNTVHPAATQHSAAANTKNTIPFIFYLLYCFSYLISFSAQRAFILRFQPFAFFAIHMPFLPFHHPWRSGYLRPFVTSFSALQNLQAPSRGHVCFRIVQSFNLFLAKHFRVSMHLGKGISISLTTFLRRILREPIHVKKK